MKCRLREMIESDLQMVLLWRNHPDVRKNMYTSHEISYEEHLSWWDRESNNSKTALLIAEIDDIAVGVVIFSHISTTNTASWAFYSGDTSKKGVGAHMEIAALDYAFSRLKLRRLECEVLSFNYAVVEFHMKFGFLKEGIKKEAYLKDGELFDIYCLALLKKNWEKTQQEKTKKIPKKIIDTKFIDQKTIEAFLSIDDQNQLTSNIVSENILTYFSVQLLQNASFAANMKILAQEFIFIVPVYIGSNVEFQLKVISHFEAYASFNVLIKSNDSICAQGEIAVMFSEVNV